MRSAAEHPKGIYLHACPHCMGPIGDDRLQLKLPCPKCLPEVVAVEDVVEAAKALAERRVLRKDSPLAFYARVEEEAKEVEELFYRATGSRLWSAQRTWVRRVLKGKSFAIIAPTGLGKTTFGVLMAVYFASKGFKSYIVLPTTPLVMMVEEKARELAEKAGLNVKVLAIHSRLRSKERRERLERLYEGDFDVLITTSRFMVSKVGELLQVRKKIGGFKFVFVDDVDAVLKSGKSVDAVLKVVGFTDEDIEAGWELLRLQRQLPARVQRARARMEKEIARLRDEAERKGRELTADEIRQHRIRIMKEELEPFYEELEKLRERVEEARKRAAVLVVSSATGRPRGTRVRLFKVLMGFEAGSRSEVLRNIVDTYVAPKPGQSLEEAVASIVRRLGGGGLVYVPVDKGVEYAERLTEYLREVGVRAESFTSKNVKALERFKSGDVDVLVGVAVYYGVAVRGLDIPERIRYAVFAGVPRLKFSAKFEDPHPLNVVRALAVLAEHAPRDVAEEAEKLLAVCRRTMQRLSQAALSKVAEELRSGRPESEAAKLFAEASEFVRRALAREDVWKALEEAPDVAIERTPDGRAYVLIPDTATYIQASGRTSRLFAGGITKGLSVVVVDDEKLLRGLIRRTRWFADAEWRPLEEVDLDSLLREIDEDRRRVREVLEGRIRPELKELVKTALMIVESPNKARTIASFFGRPSVRQVGPLKVYEVSTGDYMLLIAASGGHVYDLVKPSTPQEVVPPTWMMDALKGCVEGFDWSTARNVFGVLVASRGPVKYLPVYAPLTKCMICGSQWAPDPHSYRPGSELRCPVCGSPFVKSSWDTIEALRDVASEVDVVLVGTDPDTEGEKIGWDTASLIAPFARSIVRIEFHEVTRRAIVEALKSLRQFSEDMVKAQIVRRVEDRWIGFSLSPILWHKFWPEYCREETSARLERVRRAIESVEEQLSELRQKLGSMDVDKMLKRAEAIYKTMNVLKKRLRRLKRLERLLEARLEKRCSKPNYNLSAGRVQTPVLGWIVERTLHYRYELMPVYRLRFERSGRRLEVEVTAADLSPELKELVERMRSLVEEAMRTGELVEALKELEKLGAEKRKLIREVDRSLRGEAQVEAVVEVLEERVEEVKPFPPFTTDSMLAEAAAVLGISAPEAMRLAQDLFELGLITYHRTDSTRVSEAGIAVAREYLREKYGDEVASKLFVPRTWGVGGAHEAIRPTRPIDADRLRRLVDEGVIQLARPLTKRHYALYDLVFRRFIASQMKPGKVRVQKVKVAVRVGGRTVVKEEDRVVEVIDPGFLEIYNPFRVEEKLEPGEYKFVGITRRLKWSPVPLLSQADAVRMMKEKGIGRPSTYAKIIDTILKRAYAVSKGSRGSLIATPRGVGVYGFLYSNFRELVSEEVTRKLQEVMDAVERGVEDYQEVLGRVLGELVEKLSSTDEFKPFAPPAPWPWNSGQTF